MTTAMKATTNGDPGSSLEDSSGEACRAGAEASSSAAPPAPEVAATAKRCRQRTHPTYEKPELLATGENEVWSWDITKLRGPVTWSYFHLYVIIDVFSRYVVGWMIAQREMTPHAVHYGTAEALHEHRAQTLQAAFVANPLRLKGVVPTPPVLRRPRGSTRQRRS
jgi:transposase InsO family protein